MRPISILVLIGCCGHVGAVAAAPAAGPSEEAARLREMYADSVRLANQAKLELGLFKSIHERIKSHKPEQVGALIVTKSPMSGSNVLLVHRDNRDGEQQFGLGLRGESSSGANSEDGLKDVASIRSEDVSGERKEPAHAAVDKSEGRQSSLFNAFKLQTPSLLTGATNPLMSGFMQQPSIPALPALPSFPSFASLAKPSTPKPYAPPKTSIIGNNGGPMAMTNDNVVVVNVFSNN